MIFNLFIEVFLGRDVTFENVTTTEYFGCDDKSGRHRHAEIAQFDHVKTLVSQVNDPTDTCPHIMNEGHCIAGFVPEQLLESVFRQFVGLLKKGMEYAA